MITIDENNRLTILQECKKPFRKNVTVTLEQKQACLKFASQIYDENNEDAVHNAMAFGGDEEREREEIFVNTLQGKIAEYGFYNYFKNRVSMQEPNMDLWGAGLWEDADFIVTHEGKEYNISIKSTKHFGNLLLLEVERYNEEGRYIEPAQGKEPIQYDWIFLIRVRGVNHGNPEEYNDEILNNIQVEISGYIGKRQFENAIRKRKILQKGILIGGGPLQVSNYWFCLTELRDPSPKNK